MNQEIKIIYEDSDVLAVYKPAGLVVHSDGKIRERTLVDWILENYPEIINVGEPITLSSGDTVRRSGIVHRLDRETSGVMLIAKNQETFLFLKRQFKERKIKKVYRAIVYGVFKDSRGTVDKPIGKSRKDFRVWTVNTNARGTVRDAVTEYKVVYSAYGFSYIEVYPKTGRTHQIRVHMKSIGHPIVCDKMYLPKKDSEAVCPLGFGRVALHAFSIQFLLRGGNVMRVEAPLPEDFEMAIDKMKMPLV